MTCNDMFVNMCFGQVVSLPQIYPVYKREISNNMYSPTASYFARCTVASMTFFFYPFLLTLCSIWFYDLQYMGIKGFCEWWGILTLTAFVGSSFGMTLGCVLPTGNAAQNSASLFVNMFAMGAGFLANAANNANWFVLGLSYISPLHFSCELLLRRILAGRDNEIINQEILAFFGYTKGAPTCVAVLVGFWFGFTILGWLVLVWRGKD